MASKRSRVQQLQKVAPATPVARAVDTFVQYKPPAKQRNTGTELLSALAEISPQLAKMAQGNRQARVDAEKQQIDNAFLANPTQFAQDVKDGKYSAFSAPAQILADENIGKRLARQYGVYLNERYTSKGIGNSTDPNAFMSFEELTRQQFIQENKDAFTSSSVTRGFAGSFRTYLQNLDAEHISNVNDNIVTRDKTTYTTGLTERIDAVMSGAVPMSDFATEAGFVETDTKLTSALTNTELTELTLKTITEYAINAEGYTYAQRNQILNLSGELMAGNQPLSNRPSAIIAIGKARATLLKMQQAEETQRETEFQRDARKVKDMTTALIIEKLAEASKDSSREVDSLELSDLLTTQQIGEAAIYFPNIRKFFVEQQNFFSKESGEVDGVDMITMRTMLTTAVNKDQALDMVLGFQISGKLKGNAEAFSVLLADVNRMKEVEEKGLPSITTDDNYKLNYNKLKSALQIKIGADGEIDSGDAMISIMTQRRKDTTGQEKQRLVQVTFPVRSKYHNRFLDEMQDLYLSEEYHAMKPSEQAKAVRALYQEIIDDFNAEISTMQ